MSSHGVTITLPARNRTGAPPSTTPGETRPAGGFFGGGGLANRFDTPPAGVDPTKYQAALAACRSKLPTGGNLQNNSAFRAYLSCLKDHGVTLAPNGGGSANGTSGTTGTTINRSDPKVAAALKTCQPLRPAGGFGRTTTTTAPPA